MDEIEQLLAESRVVVKKARETMTEKESLHGKPPETPLECAWHELNGYFRKLGTEYYIDDQIELGYIADVIERILCDEDMRTESWELRLDILKDIVIHDFYDLFDCEGNLRKFPAWLCTNPEEWLAYADFLLCRREKYLRDSAISVYRKYADREVYIDIAEKHLGESAAPYYDLITECRDSDPDRAFRLAQLALANCKDDVTDIVVFMALRAKAAGDEAEVERLKDYAYSKWNVRYVKVWEELERG